MVLNQQILNTVAEMRPLRRRAGETCVALGIPKNRAKCNRDIVNCQCMFLKKWIVSNAFLA
jgi:hypothetical protein